MLTLLIFGFLAWFAGRQVLKQTKDELTGFITFVVIAMIGLFSAGFIGSTLEVNRVVYESKPLHNLYDDSRIEGGFFLGSGSVSEPDFYFYNYVTPDGLIKPAKMYKYTTELFVQQDEDGAKNPRVEKSVLEFKDPQAWLWGFHDEDMKTIFHIPPGSIDSNFSVK